MVLSVRPARQTNPTPAMGGTHIKNGKRLMRRSLSEKRASYISALFLLPLWEKVARSAG
ncbi:hypothetical protein MNBD_ALPHA12-2178 [hydrothermal vent metagenome]|uniref:Uncharacterized protein n=1 Tax=hydrothermal vent metagenome TaxID=652676 RepID=A0A3B0UMX4_9ZZZZ